MLAVSPEKLRIPRVLLGLAVALCRAPARLIASNAGVEGEVIVEALMGQPFHMGYNAMDDRIEVGHLGVLTSWRPFASSALGRLALAAA